MPAPVAVGAPRGRPLSTVFAGRRRELILLAASSALAGLTEAGVLAALAQAAADLVNRHARAHINLGPLHLTATTGVILAVAAGLAAARLVLQVVLSTVPARIAAAVQGQLRRDLFTAFTRATWHIQSRDREGHFQEIMTDQATQAAQAVVWTTALVTALTTLLVMVASALALNVFAAVAVLLSAAGLFALLRPFSMLGQRYGQAVSANSLTYASGIGEAVRTAEEAHVFGVADAQRTHIHQLVGEIQRPFFHTQVLVRLVPGVYQSLIYLLVAGALAVLYAINLGNTASLGAVVLILVRAGTYGQATQLAYQAVRQLVPTLERVQSATERYEANAAKFGAQPMRSVDTIAFDGVSFAYEVGRPVLSSVSFTIAGGETIGIVGPSGAGKSTLVQILLRLRSPTTGDYTINGVSVTEFASRDWHRLVAYVPQEPRLLHMSVADNIRFYRDIDDAAVEHAARLAGIHDEIVAWQDGYDTLIGPRADAVSGGQQQRICLARALAGRPEVLILDEPTSALDPHSERLIQQSLVAIRHELTLFVVAHRMSTLDICERVMVIVAGRLEAFDTADRLRDGNAYYRSASTLAGAMPAAD